MLNDVPLLFTFIEFSYGFDRIYLLQVLSYSHTLGTKFSALKLTERENVLNGELEMCGVVGVDVKASNCNYFISLLAVDILAQ